MTNPLANTNLDLSRAHILIIDHDASPTLETLAATLANQNFRVTNWLTTAALEHELDSKIDLVILAIDDSETNPNLYKVHYGLDNDGVIPVVLAFTNDINWPQASALSKEFGSIECVSKSWSSSEILARITNYLSQRLEIKLLRTQNTELVAKVHEVEQQNWLISHNRQKVVIDIVNRLRDEIAGRIHQHLSTYLALPPKINQNNINAIATGALTLGDSGDSSQVQKYLWKQHQIFPDINALQIATENGKYVGVIRMEDGSFSTEIKDDSTGAHKYVYALDDHGDRTSQQMGYSLNYDPRCRQWYQAAKAKGQETWGEMYQYSSNTTVQIGIMAVQPMYDRQLLGVWGADITPWQISDFLRTLKIGRTGLTFIMERSGMIVASSTISRAFTVLDRKSVV